MKNSIVILVIILCLFATTQLWNVHKDILPRYSSMITQNAIDLTNSDSAYDFCKLDSVFATKKILMLGETTHFDGSTVIAKSEIIKYLNQKFGYDVILFEAGFYDMERLNHAESRVKPTDFLYYFWGNVKETNGLWNYLDENKSILLGGFDIQPTGNLPDSIRGYLLKDYLKKTNIKIDNYPSFYEIVDKINEYTPNWNKYRLSEKKKDSILNDMSLIYKQLLKSSLDSADNHTYSTYIRNLRDWYSCVWYYEYNSERRFHIRDSMMADNLIWQIENKYKDRKIIIWGSNLHIIHNNKEYKDKIPFTSMGEYVKNKYQDSCYTLVFSSYCQADMNGKIYETGSNKSIEYLLHQLGYKSAFIDFSKMPDGYYTSLANQKMNLKGEWTKMIDGLFFIDTMKPIQRNDDTNN